MQWKEDEADQFDIADLFERNFLLVWGKRVDIVQNIDALGYVEGGAHLSEHVVLRNTGNVRNGHVKMWMNYEETVFPEGKITATKINR